MNDQPASAVIGPLDIKRVMAALPHRYPMLLVDRVESLDPEKGIVAIKAVSMNEEFFQGHFPGRPIMPGVLQVEALAQAAGVLAVESLGLAGSGKLVYFMSIDGVKFQDGEAFAKALARRGCPLLALVPYPPERWPGELRGALTLLHWDRPLTVQRVRSAVRRRRLG